MKIIDTTDKSIPKDDAIVLQAITRFEQASSCERSNRKEALDDLRMLAGFDHWPENIRKEREDDGRPALTINKLPSFVDQVLNDNRLNKISIKVLPNGGGSTVELAETFNGLIRNIENVSSADVAYQTALEGAVNNGFGYFRITSDFAGDTSFDQELRVVRIKNPLTVYMDPSHVKHDGSDCRYIFVTEMIPRKEYEDRYPGKSAPSEFPSEEMYRLWMEEDKVRIAEYWVKESTEKTLILLSNGRTVDRDEWEKQLPDLLDQEHIIHLEPNPQDPEGQPIEVDGPTPEGYDWPQTTINAVPDIVRSRVVKSHKVVQYLVDGSKILDKTEWLGKYIPIIPVWGKELVIDNERHLRGLIRFAKDPQKMYDYFRTAATETVALTPKAPYIIEEKQIEGHEDEWDSIGTTNKPYITYKGVAGQNPPMRQVVTQTAIGEITESNLANDEMKATTSMFDASLGAQGNEVSGRAIFARQREGDVANFTYHDNLKRAIKYAGDILVDLIPRIYDTERQIAIINPDDTDDIVTVNQQIGKVIINDFTQGQYKVTVTTGPSFTTQRMEATQSMLDFVRVAPEAATMMIDLIAENMDWPGAIKIARRMKKLLPPGIDDEGPPSPQEPSIDEQTKGLKAEGISLGNMKKKLDIVEKKRELEGRDKDIASAGARGAMQALGLMGDENGTQGR